MKSVGMPVIDYDGMGADAALIKFYTVLGFDPKKHTLNPKKVKVSERDLLALVEQMKALNPDDPKSASLLMLNYGPSCDYNMKSGKVHLYGGWVTKG
jgi:hypothetical protein